MPLCGRSQRPLVTRKCCFVLFVLFFSFFPAGLVVSNKCQFDFKAKKSNPFKLNIMIVGPGIMWALIVIPTLKKILQCCSDTGTRTPH